MPKQPQDHKPKADAADGYTFVHDGRRHTLPTAETAANVLPGRFLRDAAMEGEEGQLRLGFAMLEHVDADPDAIDALYSMPAADMMQHIQAWMQFRASDDGVSLGESSRSSA